MAPRVETLYLFSVVSSAPIEHSAYFDLTSLQKSEDEDEYDFRNDCEERALSDRTEISLDSNLSTSRRLAIVLVLDCSSLPLKSDFSFLPLSCQFSVKDGPSNRR